MWHHGEKCSTPEGHVTLMFVWYAEGQDISLLKTNELILGLYTVLYCYPGKGKYIY